MIRVLIQDKKFAGGPSIFRKRIIKPISRIKDIHVVPHPNEPFDMELSFIKIFDRHKKPVIIRIDGCYYLKSQMGQNEQLRSGIKNSTCVVFQSKFSKRMVLTMVPGARAKMEEVIHNGIDMDYINSIEPNRAVEPGSFISVAKWRETKRPMSTIRGFLEADTGRHLYMVGDGASKEWRKYKNVHILGKRSQEETISFMKACQYMLHFCYIDSCPNVVIEGLGCGLNVLCSNQQGTTEIIKDDGVVLDVDRFAYKPISTKRLDNLDPKVVAEGIEAVMKKKERVNRPDLDIKFVAEKYADVFRKVHNA